MKRTLKVGLLCLFIFAVGIVCGRSGSRPTIVAYSAVEADAGLRRVIPELQLDRVPLGQAIDRISELTNAAIVVRWDELFRGNVHVNTPVSLHVRNMTLNNTLEVLFIALGDEAPVANADNRLCRFVHDGAITITRVGALPEQAIIHRVYDVHDLVDDILRRQDGFMRLLRERLPAEDPEQEIGDTDPYFPTHPQEVVNELGWLIETSVDGESWQSFGGYGSMMPLGGTLLVGQTAENHEKIQILLRRLEEALKS